MARSILMITQSDLHSLLYYNEETGNLHWRESRGRVSAGDIAGYSNNDRYITICINKNRYQRGRLVWLYVYGKWPDGEIDHINHVRDDDRVCNLRDINHKNQMRNVSKFKSNTSGHVGITTDGHRWRARINVDGKNVSLGSYRNKKVAILARRIAEEKYEFHPNHGK